MSNLLLKLLITSINKSNSDPPILIFLLSLIEPVFPILLLLILYLFLILAVPVIPILLLEILYFLSCFLSLVEVLGPFGSGVIGSGPIGLVIIS